MQEQAREMTFHFQHTVTNAQVDSLFLWWALDNCANPLAWNWQNCLRWNNNILCAYKYNLNKVETLGKAIYACVWLSLLSFSPTPPNLPHRMHHRIVRNSIEILRCRAEEYGEDDGSIFMLAVLNRVKPLVPDGSSGFIQTDDHFFVVLFSFSLFYSNLCCRANCLASKD